MLIRLTKKRDGVGVLTIVRDDGSTAVQRTKHGVFFATHDLMHYAVETALDLRRGFFGLLADGVEPRDFEDPSARRTLPDETYYAEHLAGLLHLMWTTEGPSSLGAPDAPDRVRAELAKAAESLDSAPPGVDRAALDAIAARFGALAARWTQVEPAGSMELTYPA